MLLLFSLLLFARPLLLYTIRLRSYYAFTFIEWIMEKLKHIKKVCVEHYRIMALS